MEPLQAFGDPGRDSMERTVSVACFALIAIHKYEKQLSNNYHAEWFALDRIPRLIFDHEEMVERTRQSCNIKQP